MTHGGSRIDRDDIAADLERARMEFDRLLGEAERHTAWRTPTRGTRWTNEQLLFHMLFGYMVVRRLLLLVRVFSRLPDAASEVFARALSAASTPFDVINYCGSSAAALVYNRRRMGAKMDPVIAGCNADLDRNATTPCAAGCISRPDGTPFFTQYMTLEDVYRYPGRHFDFHERQLTLSARKWHQPPAPRRAGTRCSLALYSMTVNIDGCRRHWR
jgi:hypothetical protein